MKTTEPSAASNFPSESSIKAVRDAYRSHGWQITDDVITVLKQISDEYPIAWQHLAQYITDLDSQKAASLNKPHIYLREWAKNNNTILAQADASEPEDDETPQLTQEELDRVAARMKQLRNTWRNSA